MTAPKPTTGSVEERAKAAAKTYHRKGEMRRYDFCSGYLAGFAAAQAEGARRAVEEIEKLRAEAEDWSDDAYTEAMCVPVVHIDRAPARLRAELSAGGAEKGGEG
jgi:hypothetical protein